MDNWKIGNYYMDIMHIFKKLIKCQILKILKIIKNIFGSKMKIYMNLIMK